jgi:hypothetical protein
VRFDALLSLFSTRAVDEEDEDEVDEEDEDEVDEEDEVALGVLRALFLRSFASDASAFPFAARLTLDAGLTLVASPLPVLTLDAGLLRVASAARKFYTVGKHDHGTNRQTMVYHN